MSLKVNVFMVEIFLSFPLITPTRNRVGDLTITLEIWKLPKTTIQMVAGILFS